MPNAQFRGIGPKLKGGVGNKTTIHFAASDVLTNASVHIFTPIGADKPYDWKGDVESPSANGKCRVQLVCKAGDTMFFKRGRKRGLVFGSGDIIDVNVTVTNPGGGEVTPPQPNGIVEVW